MKPDSLDKHTDGKFLPQHGLGLGRVEAIVARDVSTALAQYSTARSSELEHQQQAAAQATTSTGNGNDRHKIFHKHNGHALTSRYHQGVTW